MSRRPLPQGTERIRGRYIYVKKGDSWIQKGRARWERYRGEIPEGNVVIFLDGNPRNCSISNLECVPRGTVTTMNRHFNKVTDPDLAKILVLWCELRRMVARQSEEGC